MKAGFISTGMTVDGVKEPKGYNDRFDHYVTWCWFWVKEIHEVTTNQEHPLTFIHPDGSQWKCDRHYWCDFGSIPPPLQSIPSLDRSRHRFPYMFHDNSYQEKGLWKRIPEVDKDGNITFMPCWRFQPLTRFECDQLLAIMIQHDIMSTNAVARYSIFTGVRIGGAFAYGKGDWVKRQPKPPTSKIDMSRFPVALA